MKFLKKTKRLIKKFLLDILFPIQCLGCGREGQWLCEKCARSLAPAPKVNNLVIPALDKIFVAGDYNDKNLARLIKKFKYSFMFALGETLGRILGDFWASQLWLFPDLDSTDSASSQVLSLNVSTSPEGLFSPKAGPLLVPIPLSTERLRWRGYNQAEILANFVSREFGYQISSDLIKIKNTEPQANLTEKTRLTNVAGCFRWAGPNLNGRTIIIIDDVVTTGATINEAALCLRQAGAKKVYGLVLAKG
jgi:ComF family protein